MNIPVTKHENKFYYCLALDNKAVLIVTEKRKLEGSDLIPADFRIQKGDFVAILDGVAVDIQTLAQGLFFHFRDNGILDSSPEETSRKFDYMPTGWFKRENLIGVKSSKEALDVFTQKYQSYHYNMERIHKIQTGQISLT